MKKITILFLLLLIPGCFAPVETETVSVFAKATVMQLAYRPGAEGHSSGDVGFTTNGDLVLTGGGTVHIPEVWSTVLRFEDGQCHPFYGKEVYERAVVGQEVDVEYVKLYRVMDSGKKVFLRQMDPVVHFKDAK